MSASVTASRMLTLLRHWIVLLFHPSSAPTPPPAAPEAPAAPKDVLEALEQRRAKYLETSSQAKANGDDRKARMHDRIAKVEAGVYISYIWRLTAAAFVIAELTKHPESLTKRQLMMTW